MCGIAGIVRIDGGQSPEPSRLRDMRDVLRHRGPDGEGLWIEGPAGLAHRRLSIVDIAGGAQPMASEDGRLRLTFNGEIYNHRDVRARLEARGHRYTSRSDTESILHLYEEYGDACVEHLQGMFAFALWDRQAKRLLLARDRLGIKPMYYAITDREILFGSEIKALVAAGVRPSFNREVLPEFLASGYVSGEETFFSGIRKLLPGRTLSWSAGEGLRERNYWHLPAPDDDAPSHPKAHAGELRERLRETVRSHLMSDVPLGVFLSGGIDSTGLAAIMAPMMNEPLQTFSVGFAERAANELHYARLAAAFVGARHREVIVTPEQFFAALPRLVWHEDEPIAFPSSVPLYFVSALARRHVTVVLTGEGADELFAGYNRYRVTAWNQRFGEAYAKVAPRGVRNAVTSLVGRVPWSRARRILDRSFLSRSMEPRNLFFDNFSVFGEHMLPRVLTPSALGGRDPFANAIERFEEAPGGIVEKMTHADMQTYLVELLMKQDQMSMAASLESRVPFLDHVLVEHVMRMPASAKLHGWQTKAVLRESLEGLIPPAIMHRKKMGFPVPIGHWLRTIASPLLDDLVLGARARDRNLLDPTFVRTLVEQHRSGRADHGTRLWLLLNLEIWHRVFLEGDDLTLTLPGAGTEPAAA